MNLWDLNIEEIPCGWEKTYQDALLNYPNGKLIKIVNTISLTKEVFCHPVKCRDIIIGEFNKAKSNAKSVVENRENLDITSLVRQIVDADIKLYSLLDMWVRTEYENDSTSYNPDDILPEIHYSTYFEAPQNSDFYHLRVIYNPDDEGH